ncbi:MAG: dihydropteroate synthase [Gemmatimonadota bacterium]
MTPAVAWQVRGGAVSLERPVVMGVLNVTPDSFSDGDRYVEPAAAVDHALRMVDAGADLVDVGAESTRPGAMPVRPAEEWSRLSGVVEPLARRGVTVSIDTMKAEVAARALDAGAAIVNDVSGLENAPAIADLCARTGAGLVLMHMRGSPRTMQEDTTYDDLVGEVTAWLDHRARAAREAGCAAAQIVIDPGIGFGKSTTGNLELLARTAEFTRLGYPVLVGPSRKSFIGTVLDLPVERRLEGTLAACLAAFERGARIFRVHDVGPARRALDLADAIRRAGPNG